MKIYVALTNDRHADPEVDLYFDLEQAKKESLEKIERWRSKDEEVQYKEWPENAAGWIVSYTYSCEGDNIFIMEKEIVEAKSLCQEITHAPKELFHQQFWNEWECENVKDICASLNQLYNAFIERYETEKGIK